MTTVLLVREGEPDTGATLTSRGLEGSPRTYFGDPATAEALVLADGFSCDVAAKVRAILEEDVDSQVALARVGSDLAPGEAEPGFGRPDPEDLEMNNAPICPACGNERTDLFEDGDDMFTDGAESVVRCQSCDTSYHVSVSVFYYYTTAPLEASEDAH